MPYNRSYKIQFVTIFFAYHNLLFLSLAIIVGHWRDYSNGYYGIWNECYAGCRSGGKDTTKPWLTKRF